MKLDSFNTLVDTFKYLLLLLTSASTIAFSMDRMFNHDLHIGGGFFLFLGSMSFTAAVIGLIDMADRNKSKE